MCLENAKINIKELFSRNKKSIILWKVVDKQFNGFNAVCRSFTYKIDDVNISSRISKRTNQKDDPHFKEYQLIDKGFHFHREFIDAYKWATYQPSTECIVPVICDREDYVAHNDKQAIFTKFRFLTDNINNYYIKEYNKNLDYYLNRNIYE